MASLSVATTTFARPNAAQAARQVHSISGRRVPSAAVSSASGLSGKRVEALRAGMTTSISRAAD
jgi:hypothetical protein